MQFQAILFVLFLVSDRMIFFLSFQFINMHKLNPDQEFESLKREVAAAYRPKSS